LTWQLQLFVVCPSTVRGENSVGKSMTNSLPSASTPSERGGLGAARGSRDYVEGRLLDGFLLLAAGGSSSPEDVVSVNLSSLQIVDVAFEDLAFFGNLDKLDVSDNQLSYELIMEHFGRLPRVSTLLLSCNSISSLQLRSGLLRSLQTLDLSFNELHGDVLAQLAHLPKLTSLDLSSNCISSVPPEEDLYALQALEELCLAANDLVQFVQWRALDALPRLRKLSLASNRVKRLKDDAPDTPGGSVSYFRALQELDLSSNEIVGVDSLPAVQLFPMLRSLHLSDNPCTRNAGGVEPCAGGASIQVQDSKPWYLCGGGCFWKHRPATEPKLKLNRGKMRKVRSSMLNGPKESRRSGAIQLGVLDNEANRLLVSLREQGGASGVIAAPGVARTRTSAEVTAATAGPLALEGGGHAGPGLAEGDGGGDGQVLHDDLSEEELDAIFRERRANIERKFNAPAEEPVSFMRPTPFQVSAAAGRKLGLAGPAGDEEEEATGAASPASLPSGVAPRPSSSAIFITGMSGDDGGSASRESSTTAVTRDGRVRSSGPTQAASATAALTATATMAATALPPIQAPGSRGSSASGVSRSDPLDMLLTDGGARSKPIPDIGVREAMRALRAAALSEYAVAA